MTDFAKRQELKLMFKAHCFEGDLTKLVETGEASRSDLKEVLADIDVRVRKSFKPDELDDRDFDTIGVPATLYPGLTDHLPGFDEREALAKVSSGGRRDGEKT